MLHRHDTQQAKSYAQLKDFLAKCSGAELQEAFQSEWLNKIIPGLDRLSTCDQGRLSHLEGDVAAHTALVFENLSVVATNRLGRSPDFIEQLAVVMHDLQKPATRHCDANGSVSFPQHEARAAQEVPAVASRLALEPDETARLHFLVASHGDAHEFFGLTEGARLKLRASPWIISLALLQEADARSCIMPGGHHLPVLWDSLVG